MGEEQEAGEGGESYQLEMMRCLRDVNADNNTVGWYQSTISGSYQVGLQQQEGAESRSRQTGACRKEGACLECLSGAQACTWRSTAAVRPGDAPPAAHMAPHCAARVCPGG
mgnify:CR=1 FL=1